MYLSALLFSAFSIPGPSTLPLFKFPTHFRFQGTYLWFSNHQTPFLFLTRSARQCRAFFLSTPCWFVLQRTANPPLRPSPHKPTAGNAARNDIIDRVSRRCHGETTKAR